MSIKGNESNEDKASGKRNYKNARVGLEEVCLVTYLSH